MLGKIIAVDLDGTILEGDGVAEFGAVKPLARETLNALWYWGYKIIVWTCRQDLLAVSQYLREMKIPYDAINENVPEVLEALGWTWEGAPRKIYYTHLIDDRAGFDGDWQGVARRFCPRGGEVYAATEEGRAFLQLNPVTLAVQHEVQLEERQTDCVPPS